MKSHIIKFLSILFALVISISSMGTIANAEESTSSVDESTTSISKEEAQKMLEDQRKDLAQKLKDSEEKLSQFSADQQVTAEYINALDEKIGYLNEELTLLDEQVRHSVEKVESLTADITSLNEQIEAVEESYLKATDELERLEKAFESTYNAYCLRLRAMYVSGSNSILVALLTSKDISQFFSRYEMIKAISKSDSALLDEVNDRIEKINSQSDEIKNQKDILESDKAELDSKKNELISEQKSIETNQSEIASKKITLATDRAQSDNLLAQYSAASKMYGEFKYTDEELIKKVDKEIDDLLSGLKSPDEITTASGGDIEYDDSQTVSTSPLYVNSNAVLNMSYPTSSHGTSATFGSYKGHTGTDFPISYGQSVYAAQKGIVITSTDIYDSKGNYASYGRYIMIYHGTDAKGRKIVTLYAHNSKRLVGVGQTVEKGQIIANGGSTGNSTGPHCHFEIRMDGTPVNPAFYLS